MNCKVCNKFTRPIDHFFAVGVLPTESGYTIVAPRYFRMKEGEVVPYCGPLCATKDMTNG